ncbi:tail assembly chaperone [Pseudomonas putida]|uniref:putative phage tail assembly chaperone n=1 Tax=Pseudomonas putida TaxID=303 RepID=UPI00104DCADE|nr:putative phage tail assembly chaperone [Pseudomonas putida]TCP73573.1 tail assembly chaperone [Pseudomonas putida]
MTDRTEITLEVGDQEFDFTVDPALMTKYINSMTQSNKVAPSHNLLMSAVNQEQKATLKPLLVNPVTAIQIAGALMEEYSPTIEVTVKKRSTTLSA